MRALLFEIWPVSLERISDEPSLSVIKANKR
jgi:hypothetical protein